MAISIQYMHAEELRLLQFLRQVFLHLPDMT